MITQVRAYLSSFVIAAIGGALANLLHLPIPWLLGSLFAVGGSSMLGMPIKSAALSRKAGLMIIGISLGLYFTPQMVGLLGRHAYLLVVVAAFSLCLGVIGSVIVHKLAKVDFKTAWFASVIGGASEMSNLAHQQGAKVDQVVAAHSLRVFMVVTIVPFFYKFMGYRGDQDEALIVNASVSLWGLLALLGLSLVLARLFEYKNWSNPWTFAPLLVAALFTAADIHLSAMPYWLSALGQICIGWTLGAKFKPDFFATAPKLLVVTAVCVVIHLILTVCVTVATAHLTGMDVAILGLGFAPGGVAEMTITAKTLSLGVPMVTMFHVVRMVVVIGTAGILYRWLSKRFFGHS